MPEVTVVVPTRDRPHMLAQALRSVLCQVDVDLEVMVVDDSEGASAAPVVARLADPRVRLVRHGGVRGAGAARNTGIAEARGRWIAFLDDDDLWAPTKLSAQLAGARAADAGWVYGGDVTVDASLRVIGGDSPPSPAEVVRDLPRHNAVPAGCSNVAVRRDVLSSVGTFDSTLATSEDWDLWIRLASVGEPARVSGPLVAIRSHPAMASRSIDRMLADIDTVAARYKLPVDRARHERWAAWMCLERGSRGAALSHYARAILAGDLKSIARAGVAVVRPGLVRRPASVSSWAREADLWLEPIRQQAACSDGRQPDRIDG